MEMTMSTPVTPEVIVEKRTIVGEGSLWDAEQQVLYWIDILSHELYVYDPATGDNRTIPTAQAVGTVVKRASGGLVLALHNGFAFLDLDTERITPIADPERDIPANRFNDGKCDPAGRFWAGTMEFNGEPDAGALYCLDAKGEVTEKLRPVAISNGIVWTADAKTLYYICTRANTVRAFDYDIDTGDISNERVVVTNQGEGGFDGMSIDAEGKLWVAVFGGWAVRRYDPDTGNLLQEVKLPFERVTSCAFGGKNLDELYVTSAVVGLDDAALVDQPQAGSLVKIDPGVQGVPAFSYAG
jgi:sugar lactone lactonase YvrE